MGKAGAILLPPLWRSAGASAGLHAGPPPSWGSPLGLQLRLGISSATLWNLSCTSSWPDKTEVSKNCAASFEGRLHRHDQLVQALLRGLDIGLQPLDLLLGDLRAAALRLCCFRQGPPKRLSGR